MNTLDSIIAHYASQQRAGLLPALQAAQVLDGYLSRETITHVAKGLGVPPTEAYGVVKFYSMLYTEPTGRRFVRVCDDVLCQLAGARQVVSALEAHLGVSCGETTSDGSVTLEAVPCLGACHRAPVALVDDTLHEGVGIHVAQWLNRESKRGRPRRVAQRGPHLLREINVSGMHQLKRAQEHGRYDALRKALATPREQVVAEVKAAGLVGRGGAAFPTGVKWEGAAKEIKERGNEETRNGSVTGYVICNADESETGTFKDRILMERDPHRLVEAMAIAAHAVGANRGIFYVRGEYPLAYERLSDAIDEAREAQLLGAQFDIEMRAGAGAYVCGEETALLESIEGKRGEPRVKPPFPTTFGLFGKPTVINNVETLANVPGIIANGAAWYRQWGTAQSPGTRLVCLSGNVQRAGLYEISMGLPLRDLIFNLGGGLPKGRTLQAALVGGAAGAFVTPAQLDVAMDFQSLTAVGATFGSGAVMVFDDTVNLWDVLKGVTKFFAHESCGKCFPCQLGTQRQMEIVARISAGDARASDQQTLVTLGQTM
ncbi:MAG: NAD(P)H-dependent oxidoreductase subunit E, partial [Chloroflexota bacterium]